MSPSQPPSQERRDTSDLEKGRNAQTTTGILAVACPVLRKFISVPLDFHREKSRSSQKQSSLPPSQPESNFGDSSGPIFSLYSKAAKEEDDGKVERWQKEADGILIFVSPCLGLPTTSRMNWNYVDRSILCLRRCIARSDRARPQAKCSRYLCILPWQYLSDSRRPERHRFAHIHTLSCRQAPSVLSSWIRRLGQFALVSQLSYQPYLRAVGNLSPTMGTSIHQGQPTIAVQPGEASTITCILCSWRGQNACSLGS